MGVSRRDVADDGGGRGVNLLDYEQVGTVEILIKRTYAIDGESSLPIVEGIVKPGVYPLYQIGEAYFWVMDGVLGLGGVQRVGDGLFVAAGRDVESEIAVRFPSRTFGPKEWKEMLGHPQCKEGHPEQRLRIQLQEGG